MAEAVSTIYYRKARIFNLDGDAFDISGKINSFDYFEDVLKQSVSAEIELNASYSYVNQLPIRGGEKVELDILTSFGENGFQREEDTALYVYKVSKWTTVNGSESCKLHLTTLEHFSNESTRCMRKYNKLLISEHVRDILENTLQTKKDIQIESTANSYTFIGNTKKPFYTMTWLGSKSISKVTEKSGVSGEGKYAENKGTAGFLLYENIRGFNFRSVDSLVANTQVQNNSSDLEPKFKYIYEGKIIEENKLYNALKIINYNFEKTIDLKQSLPIGMYCNQFYSYDTRKNILSLYNYKLRDEIKGSPKLGNEETLVMKSEFTDIPTRTMFRTSDHGTLDSSGSLTESQSDSGGDAMLAKSASRMNLLFTQALNILVPLNIELAVGDLIYCEFPRLEGEDKSEVDENMSGNYVIREVRHHFAAGQCTSSLKLMRDSYGLYGPNQ